MCGAGEVRTVEIAEVGSRFQPRRFIETGMADIHDRIVAAGSFAGLRPDGLDARAGHFLDLARIDPTAWPDAARRSDTGDHAAMTRCIRDALT